MVSQLSEIQEPHPQPPPVQARNHYVHTSDLIPLNPPKPLRGCAFGVEKGGL